MRAPPRSHRRRGPTATGPSSRRAPWLTLLSLMVLLAWAPGCIPGGGGGGGGDGSPDAGPDPEPEPGPGPIETPEPEVVLDPEPEPQPQPVTGPQACIDADADWSEGWRAFEDRVLVLVNQRRAAGADCRTGGAFEPTHALGSDEQLRCAARLHSRDMGERGYFDHLDPQGVDPGVRIQAAEYSGFPGGENIAAGAMSPEDVVDGWMDSDGHCSNIMRPAFDEIGIGFAEIPGSAWRTYWTQTFGFAR